MKVLGIYGSPRQGGNSDQLLDRALGGARDAGAEVSSIRARELKVEGCRECGGCDETGECVIDDEMQRVYELLTGADAIIAATPIFFYTVPAQLKAVIDRCQAMWNRRRLSKPREQWKNHGSGRGYLIAVGATRGAKLFDSVELVARYFFDALDMSYQGGVFSRGLDEKGAVAEQPELLQQAYELGRQAALPVPRKDRTRIS
jgi:multimeric flavodoxin WrbA